MADGFQVNLKSLDDAAEGVSGTITLFDREKVSDIPFDAAAIGDDGLAGSTSDFLSGWQRGVNNLAQDGKQISARLTSCAGAYRKADSAAKDSVNGILQGAGKDPGTAVN
jgi:hypothetical protein